MIYIHRILYNSVYIYHHIISISLIIYIDLYHNQNYLSTWVLRVLIFVHGFVENLVFLSDTAPCRGFPEMGMPYKWMFFSCFFDGKSYANMNEQGYKPPFLHLPEIGLNSLRCLHFLIHQL